MGDFGFLTELPVPVYSPPPDTDDNLRVALLAAQSGDTVEIAGDYAGTSYIVPAGVTLQPPSGATLRIDVGDSFDMRGATVKNAEIYSSANNDYRRTHQTGINMSAENSRLIGCTVHNIRAAAVALFGARYAEVSECVFYDNWYQDDALNWRGPHIYTHNHHGGEIVINNNLFLASRGSHKVAMWSASGNAVHDYVVTHNIITGAMFAGSAGGVHDLTFNANTQYGEYCWLGYNFEGVNTTCAVTNNLFQDVALFSVSNFETATVTGNAHVTTQRVVINACTKSAGKLAHIAVMNPEGLLTVALDLSSLNLAHGDYLLIEPGSSPVTHEFAWAGEPVEVALTGVFHVYILKPV